MKERKNRILIVMILAFFLVSFIPVIGRAQIPHTVSYQGFLTDSGGLPVDTGEGTISVRFEIFNAASGGVALWQVWQPVTVNQGVYSVTFTGLGGLLFETQYYLEIAIDEDTNAIIIADEILTPRQPFTAVPYALNAHRLDGVPASSYLTGETDPTVDETVKDGVSWLEVTSKPVGFADNVDNEGVTSEIDPVFGGSLASGITLADLSNWNAAFNWGNHASSGYDTTNDPWTDTGNITMTTGNVGIGTSSPSGKLTVRGNVVLENSSGTAIMELGEGLDYAEGFDVSDESHIKPGTVLIIDEDNPGKLKVSEKAYDRRVAGIVAGANDLGSGIRLGAGQFDYDIALAGRVYCYVDATKYGIKPGDLLTTSDNAGYAMKASEFDNSHGAILGKAMEGLEKGKKRKILVLVTLQ